MNMPKAILTKRMDLQRLLKAIEDSSDIHDTDARHRLCPHCWATVSDYDLGTPPIEHERGCVVLWARELGTRLIGGAK